jgi:hypothetical protein
MLHEFLQMALCDDGRSLVLLCHGSRRKEEQHLQDFHISSYFLFSFFILSCFFPLFSFLSRQKEESKERMADEAQGDRGAQGRSLALNPEASVVK